jgi:hypothetical protein
MIEDAYRVASPTEVTAPHCRGCPSVVSTLATKSRRTESILNWGEFGAARSTRLMSERSLLGLGKGFFALLLCLRAVQASGQERDNGENHPSLGDKNAPFATTLPDAL